MARTLVTGSAGFIGSWLCEALRDRGHKVYGADSCVGGRNSVAGVPLFVGDLSDNAFARHVAESVQPDVLVHCASDPREGGSWFRLESVTRNNLAAYCSILEACLRRGLSKVCVMSSMSVYGDQTPPFTEDMSTLPVDPYGVNKAAMEAITAQMADAHDFDYVILRPHNVIGPRQFVDPIRNVATIFANQAAHSQPITVFGDGGQCRAFSNIRDSLPCYIRAIEYDDANGMTFNIGGEEHITVNTLAETVYEQFRGAEIVHLPARHGEVRDAYCDHTLAKKWLGFKENHGWIEAVHEICEWTKQEGPFDWEPVLLATPSDVSPKHWKTKLD